MSTLISRLLRFASSPAGRRVVAKGRTYASSPQGRAKIDQVRRQISSRGTRRP